MSITFIINT